MSVRKRTWTTAKGEQRETWLVDYRDQAGKRRFKAFAKKKEADAFHVRARHEVGEGVHVPDRATVTVPEAGDRWIESARARGLERTTIEGRKQHLRLHIIPYVGGRKLSEVTVPLVRDLQDKLRTDGRSAVMIRKVTTSLGGLLADAQERGLVARNAVREMSARRGNTGTAARQKARLQYGVDIPTLDETRAVIQAMQAGKLTRYRPLLLTAIFTGMRTSELRGLRWADVDLEKGRLHVRQRADRFHAIGMPKSAAGQRTIPLTPMVVNTLREWKVACPKAKLDLVFPTQKGSVESHPNIVQRRWHPVQLAAGVVVDTSRKDEKGEPILAPKYGGLHALRHWYASWCINCRADGGLELPPKAVQERLGHSSITMTMDVYGHLFPTADEADALAAAEQALMAIPTSGEGRA